MAQRWGHRFPFELLFPRRVRAAQARALHRHLRDTISHLPYGRYALLEEHGLSFDLQCNPHQLVAAAALAAAHPRTKVVLNHLGCLRLEGTAQSVIDEKMRVWREGMAALAAQPHVCVKLSMLPYTRRPL